MNSVYYVYFLHQRPLLSSDSIKPRHYFYSSTLGTDFMKWQPNLDGYHSLRTGIMTTSSWPETLTIFLSTIAGDVYAKGQRAILGAKPTQARRNLNNVNVF